MQVKLCHSGFDITFHKLVYYMESFPFKNELLIGVYIL